MFNIGPVEIIFLLGFGLTLLVLYFVFTKLMKIKYDYIDKDDYENDSVDESSDLSGKIEHKGKWEYKILENRKLNVLEEIINEKAKEGWIAVNISRSSSSNICLMKRKLAKKENI